MDSIVLAALIGVFVSVISAAGLVAVAIINSRKERGESAQLAMERVYAERITLKDEIIKELRSTNANLTATIEKLQAISSEET